MSRTPTHEKKKSHFDSKLNWIVAFGSGKFVFPGIFVSLIKTL